VEAEYSRLTFEDLRRRLCDALRGNRAPVIAEIGGQMEAIESSGQETRILNNGDAEQGAADGQRQAVMPFAFAKATPAGS
jgi:hypothetical protein